MRSLFLVLAALLLSACQSQTTHVLIGATVYTSAGANPLEDSVIVIDGAVVRAVGARKDVPIPQDSERTDLAGKWVVPASNGTITPGQPADLLVLTHAPVRIEPANQKDVVRRFAAGMWQ